MVSPVPIVATVALLWMISHSLGSDEVPFTPLTNSTQTRAVCMDGSPAGYHHASGSGLGAKSWLLYLMGGGWCPSLTACLANTTTPYGSTRFIKTVNFTGMLSKDQDINPDFFNWNRVYVYYCDQSSFLGDTEIDGHGSKLQFRGSRIFYAAIDELLAKGMSNGDNAILAGRSAGGLAAILHCDGFRARLHTVGRVKCFSDAGFFIRAKNLPHADYREHFFASTIRLHNISGLLPTTCTKRINSSLCLFPEYLVGHVKTPLFLLNSAFDYYQVQNLLVPPESPDWTRWNACLKNLTNCPAAQELINDFGMAFVKAIRKNPSNPSRGLFIHACFTHVATMYPSDRNYWTPNSTVKLGDMTMLEATGILIASRQLD